MEMINTYLFAILILIVCYTSKSLAIFEFPNANSLAQVDHHTLRQLHQIDTDKLKKSIVLAEKSVNSSEQVEKNILRSIRLQENSISYGQWLQGYPVLDSTENNYLAAVILKSSLYVLNKECREKRIPDAHCAKYISTLSLPDCDLKEQCEELVEENAVNGLQSYRRLLPANYNDGIHSFRASAIPRKSLPSARDISEKFYTKGSQLMQADSNYQHPNEMSKQPNLILPQWTYFIDHDLAKTVISTMINGEPIECCTDSYMPLQPRHRHSACSQLQVRDNDSFYGKLGVTCLNYVRSALSVSSDCKLGPAEQLSEASGTFDLSQLYGYNGKITKKLRSHVGGEMKKTHTKWASTLPYTDANNQFCMHNSTNRVCYLSSDPRINRDPYTTVIYAIFHTSHNQIAGALHEINPHWTDEQLFTTAKAINIGLYQKIIYTEWLANVLGEDLANKINAELPSASISDARVTNEFATAAIRFSNSMIPGDLFAFEDQMHGYYGNLLQPTTRGFSYVLKEESKLFSLRDVFFKPKNLGKRMFAKSVIKASFTQKAMKLDTCYEDDFSSQLFRARARNGKDFGTDSLALDIQRGRDHGLSPYVQYVKVCQNITTDIQKWDDLEGMVYEHDLDTMKSTYQTVADIDLIVGLLAEIPGDSQLVGPTMGCILGEQISNSKRTDPTFYTVNMNEKIKNTVSEYTGAKLLCDTLNLENVPKNIFKIPSMSNLLVMCSDAVLPGLNLEIWKE